MDPNSSTFCVNYLSQFPLIKPETINTLCFNGFSNYHQLAQLDVESDLPFIRDISLDQKAAVKRALIRFAGHTNNNSGNNGTNANNSSSSSGSNTTNTTTNSNNTGHVSCVNVSLGSNTTNLANSVSTTNQRNGTSGNSTSNSFYSINESVVDAPSSTSTTTTTNSSSSISNTATTVLDVSNSSNNSINSNLNNSVTQTTAAASANGTECHKRRLQSTSVSSTVSASTAITTEVIVAANSAPPSQHILLAGKNNSSSTSSIYQRIDQFNLPSSSKSKLSEASSSNFVTTSNENSLCKRRKQNETVTASVNSATLSLPSSSSSSPSSSSSTLLLSTNSSKSNDLENILLNDSCNSSKYQGPKRLLRICVAVSSTKSTIIANPSPVNNTVAPICTFPTIVNTFRDPKQCIKLPNTGPDNSVANKLSLVKNEEPALNSATRMPYAIFEQLECAKKLENGQKSMLYHFGNQETNDVKKDLISNSGRSLSGDIGDVNFLLTNKVNSSSPTNFDALSSANVGYIINSPTFVSSGSSDDSGNKSVPGHNNSGGSPMCNTSQNCQDNPITSQSSSLLNSIHMTNNVVVSSENSAIQSNLRSTSLDLSNTNNGKTLNDSMQIRDYLSEINVPPNNLNSISTSNSDNNSSVTNDVLANSVASFLTPSEHQQLVKNGSIIIDPSSQSLDHNINNYVYSTLQLQLAPSDPNKSPHDPSKTQQLYTLDAANVTTNLSQQSNIQQVSTSQQEQNAPSRRGRGRPKKYTDPLSLAVEQCLENSNSPTQPTVVSSVVTQFTGAIAGVTAPSTPVCPISTTIQSIGGAPTVHVCRWQDCSFSSSDILEFRNHNRTQHRDESTIIPSRKGKSSSPKEPLICEVPGCGYSPKYRRLLIDHQNAHKGLRAHKCCFCEYNSSYFGDIRKHMIKKHPDLAQEIKLSKLKLKQNGLDGKNSKLSKREIDELSHKMATEAVKAKKGTTCLPDSNGKEVKPKRRSYTKKKKSKKGENATPVTVQTTTPTMATTYQTVAGNDAKQTLSISNLALAGTGAQGNTAQTTQYGFMAAPSYGHLQLNNVTGGQSDHLMTNNGLANYSTLNAANLVPQTAIIYLQTSPTSGNTVQLASNDMSALNQIIGYTDINSLNGQISIGSGHPQMQNIGTSFTSSNQVQTSTHQTRMHDANALTSICLDSTGTGQGATLAFVTDSHHQQQGQHHTQTTTIYKCDYPLCYYQSEQYEAMLIHKHRDHPMQQLQQGQSQQSQHQQSQAQQQQQQITIIDASTLAAAVNNPGQSVTLSTSNHPHQQQQQHAQHHQMTTMNTSSSANVSSPLYALATSNSVTSTNFVHALDYGSITTTTTAASGTNLANQQVNSSSTLNSSRSVTATSDPKNSTLVDHSNIDPNGSGNGGENHILNVSGMPGSTVANMIFTGDPNALFFNSAHQAHQIVTAINGNDLITVTSTSTSSSTPSSTSSLVAAAVANAGITDSPVTTSVTN